MCNIGSWMPHITLKFNMLITKLKISFPNYSSYVLFVLIRPAYGQMHNWSLGSICNIPLPLILPPNQSRIQIKPMSKKGKGDMWFLVTVSDQGLHKAWSVPDIIITRVNKYHFFITWLMIFYPLLSLIINMDIVGIFSSPGFKTILTLFSSFFFSFFLLFWHAHNPSSHKVLLTFH